jgi:hypothetical protein
MAKFIEVNFHPEGLDDEIGDAIINIEDITVVTGVLRAGETHGNCYIYLRNAPSALVHHDALRVYQTYDEVIALIDEANASD